MVAAQTALHQLSLVICRAAPTAWQPRAPRWDRFWYTLLIQELLLQYFIGFEHDMHQNAVKNAAPEIGVGDLWIAQIPHTHPFSDFS